MQNYHPSQAPDAEQWLALDESLRTALVQDYHAAIEAGLAEEAENMHAIIHVVVENKLALKEKPALAAASRLVRQGLSRHEAIHAIGAVLSEEIFTMLQNDQEHNTKLFSRRLDKLTAKRWKKGKY